MYQIKWQVSVDSLQIAVDTALGSGVQRELMLQLTTKRNKQFMSLIIFIPVTICCVHVGIRGETVDVKWFSQRSKKAATNNSMWCITAPDMFGVSCLLSMTNKKKLSVVHKISSLFNIRFALNAN